jgi:hypothetical protein
MKAKSVTRKTRVRAQDTGFQGYQPQDVLVQQPKKSKKTRTDGD